MAVVFIPSALAVHDAAMQLDGDVSTHAYTVPSTSNPLFDWGGNTAGDSSAQASPNNNGIFSVSDNNATSTETVSNNPNAVGAGKTFAAASFKRDFESGSSCTLDSTSHTFCTADDSTYATGSKDTLGIGNGGWQCNHDNNVNSKIDIMNAYTASYFTGTNSTGDHIIYFAMEKNKNNGTNDVGFWFLQGDASCSAPSGHLNFSGQHKDGDVLVVSEFTQGGGVSTIKAFRWAAATSGPLAGDGGCIDSNDNPDPRTGGCNGLPIGTGGDCKTATTGSTDAICGTTNANCTTTGNPCSLDWNKTVATPWLTSDATGGVGNDQIVSPDFFEGGIDITKVFAGVTGSTPSCFNTVIPDTRSSSTVTATLFDFVVNKLGECTSSIVTTPKAGDGTSAVPTSIGTSGSVSVTDSAQLTVTGVSTWSGNVKFFLCGPIATGNCSSAGTRIAGSTEPSAGISVNQGTTQPIVSAAATVTSAGRYCWRAEFAATSPTDVPSATDPNANSADPNSECFTLAPVPPTLSTTPSNSTSGTAATCCSTPLDDTINLSGTANEPGTTNGTVTPINPATAGGAAQGTITVNLYGPSNTAVCTDPSTGVTGNRVAQVTISVSGDSSATNLYKASTGTLVSGSLTPSGPGHYWWTASYSGDPPNTLPAPKDSNNAAIFTTCGDEESFVAQIPTALKTKQSWYPNDTAAISSTLSGDQNIAGTVDFTLYQGDCSTGIAKYTERVSISNGTSPQTASTSNYPGTSGKKPDGTGVTVFAISTDYADLANSTAPASGTYSWKVVYTPTDTSGHLGRQSSCTEVHSITYTNDAGPGTQP